MFNLKMLNVYKLEAFDDFARSPYTLTFNENKPKNFEQLVKDLMDHTFSSEDNIIAFKKIMKNKIKTHILFMR